MLMCAHSRMELLSELSQQPEQTIIVRLIPTFSHGVGDGFNYFYRRGACREHTQQQHHSEAVNRLVKRE